MINLPTKEEAEREKRIAHRHWIFTNKQLKRLPWKAREQLVRMAKEDVHMCFKNNGMYDPICLDMAEEVADMETYLVTSTV